MFIFIVTVYSVLIMLICQKLVFKNINYISGLEMLTYWDLGIYITKMFME